MSGSALANTIADQSLRVMYVRLVEIATHLHPDVRVEENTVELRVERAGELICRVVPYRELLHVQVGRYPTWETRVRDAEGFRDAVHRVIECFLSSLGSPATSP